MVPSLDYSASLAAYTAIPAPVDTTPPVITLLGTNPQTVTQASCGHWVRIVTPKACTAGPCALQHQSCCTCSPTGRPLTLWAASQKGSRQLHVQCPAVPLQGQAYVEAGATAKDNVDPIVSNIIITGTVNNMMVSLQPSCLCLELVQLWL